MKVDCVTVNLRGLELRIPSLTGAELEDHEAEINALLAPKPEQTITESLEAIYSLTLAACRATHPDLNRQMLARHLDLRGRSALVGALLGTAAGFEAVEVQTRGEG